MRKCRIEFKTLFMEFLTLAQYIWNILTMWSNSLSLTALRKWIICNLTSGNKKQFKSFSWNTVIQTPKAQCGINLCDYSQHNYVECLFDRSENRNEIAYNKFHRYPKAKLWALCSSKISTYSKTLHWILFNFDNTALIAIKICN